MIEANQPFFHAMYGGHFACLRKERISIKQPPYLLHGLLVSLLRKGTRPASDLLDFLRVGSSSDGPCNAVPFQVSGVYNAKVANTSTL